MKNTCCLTILLVILSGCCRGSEIIIEESLPAYLYVRPVPDTVLTQEEYDSDNEIYCGAESGCICINFDPYPLLEPGDFLTVNEWVGRMTVQVDGDTVEGVDSGYGVDGLVGMMSLVGEPLRDPETDEIIAQSPDGSPFKVCYAAPLGVGQHVATVQIERTSGDVVSYSWPFTITNGQ